MTGTVDGGVELVVDGALATLRWSRPARRNAFDRGLARRAGELLGALPPEVAIVVLRPGAGPFCAGWDLRDIGAASTEGAAAVEELLGAGRALLDALDAVPAYVVAAVEGYALGFGVGILCHCDEVIAVEGVRLALPEAAAGVVPAGVLGDLVAAVGRRRAVRWTLGGAISPVEALAAGLVTAVVPPGDVDAAIELVTASITALDRRIVAATRCLGGELAAAADPIAAGDAAARAHLLGGEQGAQS